MIIKPTNRHPCFAVLRGLAEEYKVTSKSDQIDKEGFISMLNKKWTINLTFKNDDINSNIIGLEVNDEEYTFLLLKYLNENNIQ